MCADVRVYDKTNAIIGFFFSPDQQYRWPDKSLYGRFIRKRSTSFVRTGWGWRRVRKCVRVVTTRFRCHQTPGSGRRYGIVNVFRKSFGHFVLGRIFRSPHTCIYINTSHTRSSEQTFSKNSHLSLGACAIQSLK